MRSRAECRRRFEARLSLPHLEGSLNSYLKANQVRPAQLIKMCYEISKGMAYLEKSNVIHRSDLEGSLLVLERVLVAEIWLRETVYWIGKVE